MVDLTIKISDVDENDVDGIIKSYINTNVDIKVTIKKPWPAMTIGDIFTYKDAEYMFLKYHSHKRAKCATVSALVDDSVIQTVYFDCSEILFGTKFIYRRKS